MHPQKPAAYWVEKYQMQAHPKGGYFTETYRSAEQIPQTHCLYKKLTLNTNGLE